MATDTIDRISRYCSALDTVNSVESRQMIVAEIRTAAAALIDPQEVVSFRDRISGFLDKNIKESKARSAQITDPLESARFALIASAFEEVAKFVQSAEYPYREAPEAPKEVEYQVPKNSFVQPFEVFYSSRSATTHNRQVAEGVIFSNGSVAVSWINFNPHQRIYASMEEFRMTLEGNFSILYPARNGKLAEGLSSPLANVAYHEKRKTVEPTGPTPNVFAKRRPEALKQAV